MDRSNSPLHVDLPAGWGQAWVDGAPRGSGPEGSVRAYSHRGDRLVWLPPNGATGCAVDVECASRFDTRTRQALQLPEDGPEADVIAVSWWLAAELEAKILALPILHLWHSHRTALTPLTDSPSIAPWSGSERLRRSVVRPDGQPTLWLGFARLPQTCQYTTVVDRTLVVPTSTLPRRRVQGCDDSQ